MNTPRARTGQAAFTIIELMIAITVLGILLALAAPNMRDFILRNRLTAQTNDMVTALQFARSEAIKRGVPVGVCARGVDDETCDATADWRDGWIVWVDDDVDNLPDGLPNVLKVQTALEGLDAFAVTDADDADQTAPLRFLSNGGAGAAFAMRLCTTELTTENERTITVSISGQMQTVKGLNATCA